MTRREILAASAIATVADCHGRLLQSAISPPPAPTKPKMRNPEAMGYDIPVPPVPVVERLGGEPVLSPQAAADMLAIRRLQMAYGQMHEHGTADEIADLFAPDAEVYCLYLGSRGFVGRAQIRDWYAWWLKEYARIGLYYRHRPMNQVIELGDGQAISNAILGAEGAPRTQDVWDQCWGRYASIIRRTDQGWLFHRKWIILHAATQTRRLPIG